MKKNYFFNIFVIFVLFFIAYYLSYKPLQNDTFYTIKVGKSIIDYGIDMRDHFSWIPNLAYVYPHFLYDILIYTLYNLGGFNLVYFSTILFSFILLYMMYYLSNKTINNKNISLTLVIILSLGLKGFFTARAQLVSYILLLLILYSIEKLRNDKKNKYIYIIFISSLLIANMHLAVWPFVFALFLPYVMQDILFYIKDKIKISLFNVEIEKSNLKITLKALLLWFITGFMTPNFLVPFSYFIKTRSGISMNTISEHLPSNINNNSILFVLLLFSIILILYKKNKIKMSDFFLLSGLFLLSFMSTRNTSLLFILSIFSFARLLSTIKIKEYEYVLNNRLFNVIGIIISLSLIALVYVKRSTVLFIDKNEYPVEMSNYIVENLDYKNIRLFNGYNFGSYLLFKDIPVFIDSRADLYLEEFNKNCTVFKDYNEIYDNYEEIFSKYKVTHILIKDSQNITPFIKNDNNYKLLNVSNNFLLFERLTKE